MSNAAKSFDILIISLNILYNYFGPQIKLSLDLYLAKFLNTSKQNVLSMYNNKVFLIPINM